ncbi:MAG: hypothetical protein PHU45_02780 [Bacilli bacterium]|nr:hypothetical protein [Bacilli bacterium]
MVVKKKTVKKPIKKSIKKIPEKEQEIEKENNFQDSITESIDFIENGDENTEHIRDDNSLPEAILALCNGLFRDNHIKMGKLSGENKKGMTTITVINTYFENNFGYSFNSLESLKEDCMNRNISIDGFGIASLVEALKSVNMSIESSADSSGIINKLMKR